MSCCIFFPSASGPPPLISVHIRSPTYSPINSPRIVPSGGGMGMNVPRKPPRAVPPTLNSARSAGSPDNNEITPTRIGPMIGTLFRDVFSPFSAFPPILRAPFSALPTGATALTTCLPASLASNDNFAAVFEIALVTGATALLIPAALSLASNDNFAAALDSLPPVCCRAFAPGNICSAF